VPGKPRLWSDKQLPGTSADRNTTPFRVRNNQRIASASATVPSKPSRFWMPARPHPLGWLIRCRVEAMRLLWFAAPLLSAALSPAQVFRLPFPASLKNYLQLTDTQVSTIVDLDTAYDSFNSDKQGEWPDRS